MNLKMKAFLNRYSEEVFYGAILTIFYFTFYHRWPIWSDHAGNLYIAWGTLHGLKPYVDIFDTNWPGTLAISILARLLSGHDAWGLRLIDTALFYVLCIGTSRILKSLSVAIAARWIGITLMIFVYFSVGHEQTAQREAWGLPFMVWGIYFLLRNQSFLLANAISHSQKNKCQSLREDFVSGLLFSITLMIKPIFLVFQCPFLFARLFLDIRYRRFKLSHFFSFFSGFALVIGLFGAWLLMMGAFHGFYEHGIEFALGKYIQLRMPASELLRRTWNFMNGKIFILQPYPYFAFAAAIAFAHRNIRLRLIKHWRALVFFILTTGMAYLQMWIAGKGFYYQLIPFQWMILMGFVILLSYLLLENTFGLRGLLESRRSPFFLSIPGLVFLGIFILYEIPPKTEGTILGETVRSFSHNDDFIVAYGFSTIEILSAAERQSLFPNVFGAGWYDYSPQNSEMRKQILRELIASISSPKTFFLFFESSVLSRQFLDPNTIQEFDAEMKALKLELDKAVMENFDLGRPISSGAISGYRRLEKRN